jgi:hypothetical protein
MKEITCYKIEDEMASKSWTFANISEAEAQELYLAFIEDAIEEDIMETQRIEYFDLPLPKPDWWRVDFYKEVDKLRFMDSEFYMYKFNACMF